MRGRPIARAVSAALKAANQGTVTYVAPGGAQHETEAAFPRVHEGLINGTTVKVGEVVALVSADRLGDVEPTTSGNLIVDGVWHPVLQVDPIKAGEVVAAWIIQAGGS